MTCIHCHNLHTGDFLRTRYSLSYHCDVPFSDADVLWRHGELRGWDDPDITSRAAQLAEREKQYQAHEYHNPNRLVLAECEALIRSQMSSAHRTEEH